MKPTMMLYTSEWHGKPTFKMFPVEPECPYVEAIFDPEQRLLAVFSKEKKESLHMIPRLNDDGDPLVAKVKRGSKPYREQRITLDTYNEYYISQFNEIIDFVKKVAVNAEEFDISRFLTAPGPVAPVVTSEAKE